MAIFKKIIASAAVCTAALSLAVATDNDNVKLRATGINDVPSPASYTNSATAGRFGNEVDDYMDVNGWSDVEFDKAFTFVGYNADFDNDSSGHVNVGLAKELFGNYFGFWFAGNGADFQMKSRLSSDTSDDGYKNTYNYTADDGSTVDYAAAVLVGLGNIGIKATMLYQPRSSSYYKKDDTSKDYYDQQDVWRLYGDIQVGLGDDAGTHFELGVDGNAAKRQTKSDKDSGEPNGYVDNSFTDLYLRGGLTLVGWDFDLDTRWRLFPMVTSDAKDAKTLTDGYTDNLIVLTAAKGWTVEPTDRFTLKAKVGIPLSFGFYSNEENGSKVGDGDWSYATEHTHNIDIVLQPELKLGAVYQVRPGKFNFNVGAAFTLGELGWNIDATGYRDDTSKAEYKRTTTDIAFGWDSSDMSIAWSSGFTVFFGEKVTLDADWNIVGNTFSNLTTTKFNSQGVDGTVGSILFGANISLLLAVKL